MDEPDRDDERQPEALPGEPAAPDPDDLRDRLIPAAGAGSGTAPYLEAATLLGERYDEGGVADPEEPAD